MSAVLDNWRRTWSLYLEDTLALLAGSAVPEAAIPGKGVLGSNRTRQAIKRSTHRNWGRAGRRSLESGARNGASEGAQGLLELMISGLGVGQH